MLRYNNLVSTHRGVISEMKPPLCLPSPQSGIFSCLSRSHPRSSFERIQVARLQGLFLREHILAEGSLPIRWYISRYFGVIMRANLAESSVFLVLLPEYNYRYTHMYGTLTCAMFFLFWWSRKRPVWFISEGLFGMQDSQNTGWRVRAIRIVQET